MEKINLFFLHGFLGRPSDWDEVKSNLSSQEKIEIFTPDYFKDPQLSPHHNFTDWATNFNSWVREVSAPDDQNLLIGYSLGGRLAMYALHSDPKLWTRSVLISANPGFNDRYETFTPDSEERKTRWLHDAYWAEEFLMGTWETVMRNWNSLPVFSGGHTEPRRQDRDYSRESLGLALTQWSLAQQKNMRPLLRALASKIHWVVGDDDEKFFDLSQTLQQEIPQLQVTVIPEASHRVLFDQPQVLSEKIKGLIQQLV